jgi:hypothetical protein
MVARTGKETEEKKVATKAIVKGGAVLPPAEVVRQVREMADMFGLPSGAIPTLYQAYETRLKVQGLINRQRRLPASERKALVKTRRGTALSDAALKQVDSYVLSNLVPYNMLAWLEGSPYPLTEARYLHLVMDPRGLKEIVYTEKALTLEPTPHAVYECSIRFWNGTVVEGESGACSGEELRDLNRPAHLHHVVAQAKTRAFNRAAGRAIVYIGASGEEDGYLDGSLPPAGPAPSGQAREPRNVGEVLSIALQRWRLTRKDLAEKLGYDPLSRSAEELWRDLQKLVGEGTRAGTEKAEEVATDGA